MTPPVLEVAGLSVRFGGLVAVDNVSLAIPASSIHGLIGPNGAGKTTFFNAITGLVRPSQGSVAVLGQDITHKTADRRAAAGIRRTFQSVQLITPLTVLENVLIGLHTRLFTNAKGLLGCLGAASERAAQQSVLEILEFLGIAHIILKPVTEITFAEQRFVEIARALVAKPVLLMLDEPAAGLSPQEIETLDRLLRKLRDEWGMSILLVEHVLSLIMGVSDRVTVLDNGRLIAEGAPMQVAGDPKVKAAYLGQDADAVS
jgi:branched-chain amino acid transport system ATP-binding protein